MNQKEGYPAVNMIFGLDMQVCVPKDWGEVKVLTFAEEQNPCGTVNGWQIGKKGSKLLFGQPERDQCTQFDSHCHITLGA